MMFTWGVLVGLFWATYYGQHLKLSLLPEDLQGEDIYVVGTVTDLPIHSFDERGLPLKIRFDLKVLGAELVDGLSQSQKTEKLLHLRKIRLTWYKPQPLEAGDTWSFTVRLKRPRGMINPGGFDYETWLVQAGFDASGYVREGYAKVATAHTLAAYLDRIRHRLSQQLEHLKPAPKALPLLHTLLVGDRSKLNSEDWQLASQLGVQHLLAISGLHIGLAATGGYLLVALLFRIAYLPLLFRPVFWYARWGALIGGVFYGVLAGFSLPTQRAVIMLLCFILAQTFHRPYMGWYGLSLSLAMVLAWQPLSVYNLGFWLSFGAVAVLVACFSHQRQAHNLWWRWFRPQWVLAIGMLPFLVLFTAQVAWFSPLVNMIAVPLFSLLVVPLLLVGAALLPVWHSMAALLIGWGGELLGVLWGGAKLLQQWLPNNYFTSAWNTWELLLALLGLTLFLLPRGFPSRWLCILLFMPLLWVAPAKLPLGNMEVTVLDVGQGQAVVVRTRNHTLLYDTGAYYSKNFDIGEGVIAPYLRYRAIKFLDVIVVSHKDNDHSGGLGGVLTWYKADKVFAPRLEFVAGATEPCHEGLHWVWDEVHFKFIHPPKHYRATSNDRSCVLVIESSHHRVLIPGDITRRVENQLLEKNLISKASLLIAPHHGSISSSSANFVNHVADAGTYVVYSAGYRNRFNHPHPLVRHRYKQNYSKEYNTATSGALTFHLGKQVLIAPQEARLTHQRYWNN